MRPRNSQPCMDSTVITLEYAPARPLILKRITTNPKMYYEDYYTASNDV